MYNPPKILANPRLPVALLAGGASFLGSALAEFLLSKNYRVVVLDDFATGRKDFIVHLFAHPRFGLFEHDLNQGLPEKIESADLVLHLLAEARHLSAPEEVNLNALLVNSLATYHLLELTKRSRAKFLLASSLTLYQGVLSGLSLKHYFGPTLEDERHFSYNEAKRYAESLIWEYYKKYDLDLRIVRLAEVYGPHFDPTACGHLGRLLAELTQGQNLVVWGDGLDREHYLYVSDAVEGLAASLLKPKTSGKIYSLSTNESVTQLELAYLLKSFGPPETAIIFRPKLSLSGDDRVREINTSNLKDLNFKAKIKLREGLRATLDSLGYARATTTKIPTIQAAAANPPTIPAGLFNRQFKNWSGSWPKWREKILTRPTLKRSGLLLILFLLPFIVVPPLETAGRLSLSYGHYQSLKKDLRSLRLSAAQKEAEALDQSLLSGRQALSLWLLPADFKDPYLKTLTGLASLSRAGAYLLEGIGPTVSSLQNVVQGSQENPPAPAGRFPYVAADDGSATIANALDSLSLAEANLKDVKLTWVKKYLDTLAELKIVVGVAKSLVKAAPELLGFDREKNYLVLLQNSNELRPTGGFIGAVLKLKIEGGRLKPPQVVDIYDLDGQIDAGKISLPAPKILTENLETKVLHLRDANFDVSYPQSAQKIKNLYEGVSGETVDGIVALDLNFVSAVLKVVGPIFLNTYNETVTSENLFERAQFHAEAGFAPGSSAKKTFLSLLAQNLLETLVTLKSELNWPLAKTLLIQIEERHFLSEFYLSGVIFAEELNLQGEIRTKDGDFLMVVDSNLGVNKANFYVQRSIDYEVERANRDGEVNATLKVTYKHAGLSHAWPGGPYKNYLRVLVPRKASLLKAEWGEGLADDVSAQMAIDETNGKTVFAYLLTVNPGESQSLTLRYVIPPQAFPLSGSSYQLLVQKQPGTQADPFRAKFLLPFGQDVEKDFAPGFTQQGKAVIYEGNLRKDLELIVPLNRR